MMLLMMTMMITKPVSQVWSHFEVIREEAVSFDEEPEECNHSWPNWLINNDTN